jgi:hypothetical protein
MAGRYNYQTSWVQEASQQPISDLPAQSCADSTPVVRLDNDVDSGGRDLPGQSIPHIDATLCHLRIDGGLTVDCRYDSL